MYDSLENPLRRVIGAAFDNPLLLYSIIALSTRHRANSRLSFSECGTRRTRTSSTTSTTEEHIALAFKYKTIKKLSDAINDPGLCALDTTIIGAFLMIFLNVLESGRDHWNIHLKGMKSLINQMQAPGGTEGTKRHDLASCVTDIRGFVIRQIYLYALHRSEYSFDLR
jgi:hypothetical protein